LSEKYKYPPRTPKNRGYRSVPKDAKK